MTDLPALIRISLEDIAGDVIVGRNGSVTDSAWFQIRSQWGDRGENRDIAIRIALSTFLTNVHWFGRLCQRHSISVELGDQIRTKLAELRAAQHELAALLATDTEPSSEIDGGDAGRFNRDLRPFQERDLAHLLALSNGANFSVPGAGKTTVTYALYERERAMGTVDRMLVVAPISAFESWEVEAAACFDDVPIVRAYEGGVIAPDAEIVLVNYQRLLYSYDTVAAWVSQGQTHVVLDEAHRMKRGWAGEWGSKCLSLGYLGVRRDILTGTPAPNRPSDLEALMDFLWPTQARSILPDTAFRVNPPATVGREVALRIRNLFTRTTKSELDLPPVRYRVVDVPLEGLHREIYEALQRQFASLPTFRERATFTRLGQITMYLLEAATNPALLTSGSSPFDPIEFRHPPIEIPSDSDLIHKLEGFHLYEVPAKLEVLATLLEENVALGRKTLVWSNFVRNLESLKRMLAGLNPAMVHGGVLAHGDGTSPNRREELDRFRNDPDCHVLLANPAALSEGVSLHHACHDAIYLDRTFNAGQYLQSVDRIHRLGLPPGVETRVTFLVMSRTIDEIVNRRVEEKARLLGEMLDDPSIVAMALPDSDDYGGPIDVHEDMEALFRHLRGETDE